MQLTIIYSVNILFENFAFFIRPYLKDFILKYGDYNKFRIFVANCLQKSILKGYLNIMKQ